MAVRWYVMPAELVDVGEKIIRRPQHLNGINPTAPWGWMPVKDEWAIGWADLTTVEHTTYNASAGVTFLTANLNNTVSAGAVAQITLWLDGKNLPSSWVGTSVTWHTTIKRVLCYVIQIQRYWGESRSSLNVGVAKTTLIGNLPTNAQSKLALVATSLGLSSVNTADTVEQTMERWADELIVQPIYVGGIQL